MSVKQENIRNFSIIAHIDHGKSTLADRILELTGAVTKREMTEQVLDNMELERERGITIKSRAVRLSYKSPVDGEEYIFNLIDTPGHVDFNYEVSRSLSACEGALLVVDSTQGIQAQTLANAYLAVDEDLEIVPVINKVDLPAANPERVRAEIEDVIGIPADMAPCISAKTGLNVEEVLEAVARFVPAPKGDANAPTKALIFDAVYDAYRGVIVYFKVCDGKISVGDQIRMMASGTSFEVLEVGHMEPFGLAACQTLSAGEVGYLTASIKTLADARVGDTITFVDNPTEEPLEGFRAALPVVFSGIYPADGARYPDLRDALEKLQLNDAALSLRRRRVPHSASASVAASSAFYTWRSFLNAWSASSICNSSPPRRALFTDWNSPTAVCWRWTTPPIIPRRIASPPRSSRSCVPPS